MAKTEGKNNDDNGNYIDRDIDASQRAHEASDEMATNDADKIPDRS